MSKRFPLLLAAALSLAIHPWDSSADDLAAQAARQSKVSAIVDNVQVAGYKEFFTGLAVNQSSQRGYDDKGNPQSGLSDARKFIFQSLVKSLGVANVYTQGYLTDFGYAGVNIVGQIPGQKNSSYQYVVSAHYDSAENPGADDDASGVAGVLEAARVLSASNFNESILFILFDQEELGLCGSSFYSNLADDAKNKIQGMANMDMIAYNNNGDQTITLCRADKKNGSKSERVMKNIRKSFEKHTELNVELQAEEGGSDHESFLLDGFPAVLVIEHLDDNGWLFNPYYHKDSDFYLDMEGNPQQCDGDDYIDLEYATQIVKGVVGWVATEAIPISK